MKDDEHLDDVVVEDEPEGRVGRGRHRLAAHGGDVVAAVHGGAAVDHDGHEVVQALRVRRATRAAACVGAPPSAVARRARADADRVARRTLLRLRAPRILIL